MDTRYVKRFAQLMKTFERLENQLGEGRVSKNKSLATYTTLKVGGTAEFFYEAHTKEQLAQAVQIAVKLAVPYFVFGGGSNIVVGDKGISGLVIRNRTRKITIKKIHGKVNSGKKAVRSVLIEVDSGVIINQFVRFTIDESLEGFEYHLGLPGTIGGALYMNSKWTKPVTYIGDFLYEAEIIDKNGKKKTMPKSYFKFGYDQSILQETHETVLSAAFLLNRGDKKILRQKADNALKYRKETQPFGVASAGCTFRNITKTDALRIPTPDHTTSAGYLVDQVKLKGFTTGGAKFSEKHANFLINTGSASAADIKNLIDEAKKRVKKKFQVTINPEVVLVGRF